VRMVVEEEMMEILKEDEGGGRSKSDLLAVRRLN